MSANELPDAALLAEVEDAAARWAAEAGQLLLARFRTGLAVEYKSANQQDPVTEADRAAERFLWESIRARYPEHGVLGEEGTEPPHGTPFVWVIDPLDGTTNFINGLPLWCVSVGVLWQNRPVAAAIFTPSGPGAVAAVFHARAGGGAYMNGAPIAVANEPEPTKARLSGLPAHYWEEMRFRTRKGPQLGETRTLGSMALELALIGSGVLQYGVFWGPRIWDVAAGVLIVQEAGGIVLEQRGKDWLPLVEFQPPAKPPKPEAGPLAALAAWRAPLIAGNPLIAGYVSRNFSRRYPLPFLIMRLWRRIRG